MNSYKVKIALVVASLFIISSANDAEQDDYVYVLNSQNFDQFLAENDFTVVFFYAPWCGHCTNMKPFYHEAAKLLKEDDSIKSDKKITLTKVDATVESGLAARFQIQGYPTLKIFRKGQSFDYDGPRKDAKDIVDYLVSEASNSWKPPVSKVNVLANTNFTEWVQKFDISLVEFYSPNCGHCVRLAPNYEKAAKILSEIENPIPLAKVDATIEIELSEKYQISGYPTMLVFRKGRHYDYKGGREVYDIVNTMKKLQSAGSIEIKSFNAFMAKVNSPTDIHVLGFFDDQKDKSFEVYNHFASKYSEDAKLFHSFDRQEFLKSIKSDKIKQSSVIVFYHDLAVCKSEPRFAVFNKQNFSVEDLEEFVFKTSTPLVGHLSPKNVPLVYDKIRPSCYVFYDVDQELKSHIVFIRDKVAMIAKKFQQIQFALANETENFDLIKRFHLEESHSESSIVCINEKSKFFIFDEDSDSFEEESVEEFVKDFVEDKLVPFIKSEAIPKDSNKNLKKLVGKTIGTFLKTSNKHVILGLIGHDNDSSFEKKLAKLANKYSKNMDLAFAKISVFLNDLPEIFDAYPKSSSLYFISSCNKSSPIRNQNGDNFKEMVDFVEENIKILDLKKNDKLEL
ncbi:disulfide-isomerase A4 isoform X1 [Brachionus plicatilis]|uniref:Disulfide-isomerase A4 isoform X1 n=1 Tax=Brachionus plicatilis TaxID=10195 RepID=A0A3M7SAI1_BRAPC|nr:disulfide-isomerase A4 isoform X1 [Brachionus plicatilis]